MLQNNDNISSEKYRHLGTVLVTVVFKLKNISGKNVFSFEKLKIVNIFNFYLNKKLVCIIYSYSIYKYLKSPKIRDHNNQ